MEKELKEDYQLTDEEKAQIKSINELSQKIVKLMTGNQLSTIEMSLGYVIAFLEKHCHLSIERLDYNIACSQEESVQRTLRGEDTGYAKVIPLAKKPSGPAN